MSTEPRRAGRHFLQIPGPTPVPERILAAMSRQILDHRGLEFQKLGKRVLSGIKGLFKTQGHVVIFPASGTGAWESALTNTLSPGDKVFVSAASQAPVPDAGKMTTWPCVLNSPLMPVNTRLPSVWNSKPRWSRICRDMAARMRSGTGVGPGICKKWRPARRVCIGIVIFGAFPRNNLSIRCPNTPPARAQCILGSREAADRFIPQSGASTERICSPSRRHVWGLALNLVQS